MSRYWMDVAERVGATGGEAALGLLIVELQHLPTWWAALLIPALAAGKSWLAGRVGDPGTAALLPRSD